MAKIKIKTLSDEAIKKGAKVAQFVDNFVRKEINTNPDPKFESYSGCRIRLDRDLVYGEWGTGTILSFVKNPNGEATWISSQQTVQVYGYSMNQNYLPAGAEVQAIRASGIYLIVGDCAFGRIPSRHQLETIQNSEGTQGLIDRFAVFRMGSIYKDPNEASGQLETTGNSIPLELPKKGKDGIVYEPGWNYSYAALTGNPDILPDDTVPIVQVGNWPVAIGYEEFDKKLMNGDDIPEEILDLLDPSDDGSPYPGELWGPSEKGLLTRPVIALPLYWWEWSINWVPRTRRVMQPNPDFDPRNPACSEFRFKDTPENGDRAGKAVGEAVPYNPVYGWFGYGWYGYGWGYWNTSGPTPEWVGLVEPNPDYDPEASFCSPSVLVEQDCWGLPLSCFTNESDADLYQMGVTNIPITSPKPTNTSSFWISPEGFENIPGFSYDYFRNGDLNSINYSNADWWRTINKMGDVFGPGGRHWYKTLWGDRPPTQTEIDEDLAHDEGPEPSGCGQILRRGLYGYVVWEWGWPVVSRIAPVGSKSAQVSGRFQFRDQILAVNPEQPEPTVFDDV